MPAKKIQDEQEVIRWFEEGWSYQEMTEEYQRKYNIEMKPSAWGNFRYRKGLDRRIARDDELIPWAVERKHRSLYPLMMLRLEGRRRAGLPNDEEKTKRLESWKQMLEEENAVVHYDPDTVDGFFYVPREPKDDDIIRKPEKVTTLRRNADKRA
ncbi:immunity repressor [Streptomyces phage BroPlease]|nr:immunity repressor [Streptomyces phage BroPlease]USH44949.1 immunity repressor [Streptomyces phage GreenWeasel]